MPCFSVTLTKYLHGRQVADDTVHVDVQKTLYPFNTTKKMPRVTTTVLKIALTWQQGFFFTHASFQNVEYYVVNCYQQLMSRFITC